MHKLLQRQLRLNLADREISPEWQRLLDSVDAAYTQADADRLLVERSLDLMSQELIGRHERMLEERSVLSSFMDSAPLMMGLVEKAGTDIRFVSANPALARSLELTAAQLVGHTGAEVGLSADEIAAWLQFFDEVEGAAGPVHAARQYPTRAGMRDLRVTGNRVAGLAGRPTRVCVLAEDVTQELQQRRADKAELDRVHGQLVEAARQAGMAEIAVGVLHNVGNVLNSVNVSATLVSARVRDSKAENLTKIAALLGELVARPDAGQADPRTRKLPEYLGKLDQHLRAERAAIGDELKELQTRIDHIREIVAMQQGYARASGLTELVTLEELIENAVQMNLGSLERHGLRVAREILPCAPIVVEKHKVLQILVNLIRNGCQACRDSAHADKCVTVRLESNGEQGVRISVVDNGVGIAPENLQRIFNYGFTTRADGHGFGLHASALAARELGGELRVHSDGVGKGATFALDLPLAAPSAGGVARARVRRASSG